MATSFHLLINRKNRWRVPAPPIEARLVLYPTSPAADPDRTD
jgi:hypothetical protein